MVMHGCSTRDWIWFGRYDDHDMMEMRRFICGGQEGNINERNERNELDGFYFFFT